MPCSQSVDKPHHKVVLEARKTNIISIYHGIFLDYAIAIFHDVLRKGQYQCYLKPDTRLPMMHLRDALRALSEFLEVPNHKLLRRVYNVTSMSFTPEELAAKMSQHLPELRISYQPDSRQDIGKFIIYSVSRPSSSSLVHGRA